MFVFENGLFWGRRGYKVASRAFGPLGQTACYLTDTALQLFALKVKPSFIVYLKFKEFKHLK